MSSGQLLWAFFPGSETYPSSAFPTPGKRSNTDVINLDDTADENFEIPMWMPDNYDGGGITIRFGYMAASATSGTVSVDIALKSMTDDVDNISKSFATAINVNSTTASASGEIKYQTITFTDGAQMDNVGANEWYKINFLRDANSTSSTDNMVGDMQFVFLEVKET